MSADTADAAPAGVRIHRAPFDALDPATLYAILRVRVDVFVVEQRCPYPDLDGRDTEPQTVHLWAERDGRVLACCRVLAEARGSRLGRVATAAEARGRGVAGALVRAALEVADRPVVADVQARLVDWYAGFGFAVTGEPFLEDDILHVPMRLS